MWQMGVEWDWSSEKTEKFQTFYAKVDVFFYGKKLEIFENRYIWLFFSKTRLKMYFYLKMTLYLIVFEVSVAKVRKNIMY